MYRLLLVLQSIAVMAVDNPCPEGQVLDLNDKCVRRFKLPERKQCKEPEMRFGQFELKLSGRMAQFWCEDGWELAPDHQHAMCKLGAWDRVVPLCVRPGCESLDRVDGVAISMEMNGAIARFECAHSGHEIVGDPVISCDGQYWNGTVPECRVRTTTTTTTPRPKEQLRVLASSADAEVRVGFGVLLFALGVLGSMT